MVQLFAFKGKASELTHRLSLIENVGAIWEELNFKISVLD